MRPSTNPEPEWTPSTRSSLATTPTSRLRPGPCPVSRRRRPVSTRGLLRTSSRVVPGSFAVGRLTAPALELRVHLLGGARSLRLRPAAAPAALGRGALAGRALPGRGGAGASRDGCSGLLRCRDGEERHGQPATSSTETGVMFAGSTRTSWSASGRTVTASPSRSDRDDDADVGVASSRVTGSSVVNCTTWPRRSRGACAAAAAGPPPSAARGRSRAFPTRDRPSAWSCRRGPNPTWRTP
jgi:hypothetical protein